MSSVTPKKCQSQDHEYELKDNRPTDPALIQSAVFAIQNTGHSLSQDPINNSNFTALDWRVLTSIGPFINVLSKSGKAALQKLLDSSAPPSPAEGSVGASASSDLSSNDPEDLLSNLKQGMMKSPISRENIKNIVGRLAQHFNREELNTRLMPVILDRLRNLNSPYNVTVYRDSEIHDIVYPFQDYISKADIVIKLLDLCSDKTQKKLDPWFFIARTLMRDQAGDMNSPMAEARQIALGIALKAANDQFDEHDDSQVYWLIETGHIKGFYGDENSPSQIVKEKFFSNIKNLGTDKTKLDWKTLFLFMDLLHDDEKPAFLKDLVKYCPQSKLPHAGKVQLWQILYKYPNGSDTRTIVENLLGSNFLLQFETREPI